MIQNCPLCHQAMTLPDNIKIGDGVGCPHCSGDLVYDVPQVSRLPESITNPDKFAKDFARQIMQKHPYKPPHRRFCSWR